MPKFTRRHYEVMAKGMAEMAHGLERTEAQYMMSLPAEKRSELKAHVYAAAIDAMMAVFSEDNLHFSRCMFTAAFKMHLSSVLTKVNLDKRSTVRYTIDEMR